MLSRIVNFPLNAISAVGTMGYRNPCLVVSAIVAIWHLSVPWAALAIVSLVFEYINTGAYTLRYSVENTSDAIQSFMSPGCGFSISLMKEENYEALDEFKHIRLLNAMYDRLASKGLHFERLRAAVLVFAAKRTDGKLFLQSKAYANAGGPALVFLKGIPTRPFQRFMLLHEMAHVSDRGTFQLSDIYVFRLTTATGFLFLCFLAHTPIQWLVAAAYGISALYTALYLPIYREVLADNDALRRLPSDAERAEVLRCLVNHFDRRWERTPQFRTRAELLVRMSWVNSFERCFKWGLVLTMQWHDVPNVLVATTFAALSVWIGVTSSGVPIVMFVPMLFLTFRAYQAYQPLLHDEDKLAKIIIEVARKGGRSETGSEEVAPEEKAAPHA